MTQEHIYILIAFCLLVTVCVYFIWDSNRESASISQAVKKCKGNINKRTKAYKNKLKDEVVSKIKELNNDDS